MSLLVKVTTQDLFCMCDIANSNFPCGSIPGKAVLMQLVNYITGASLPGPVLVRVMNSLQTIAIILPLPMLPVLLPPLLGLALSPFPPAVLQRAPTAAARSCRGGSFQGFLDGRPISHLGELDGDAVLAPQSG